MLIPVLLLAAAYGLLAVLFPFLGIDILKYLLFQAVCILLPGYLFTAWLLKPPALETGERFFFGYPLGSAFVFLASLVAKHTHPLLLYALILPVALGAVIRLARAPGRGIRPELPARRIAGHFSAIFLLAGGLLFVLYTGTIRIPEPGTVSSYHPDSLWNLGNTWSYIRGLPLTDARFAGIPLRSHMFQNIIHAVTHETTGIEPFNLLFYLDPPLVMFMIVFVIVFGGTRIMKLSRWEALLLGFLLLFTSDLSPTFNSLQAQLFINPLSLYYSLPSFLLLLFFSIASFAGHDRHHPLLFGMLFLVAAATKALLLVIVPAAYFFALAARWQADKKRPGRSHCLTFLLMCAIALLLKIYLYQDGGGRIALLADPAESAALLPQQALVTLGEKLAAPWAPLHRVGLLFTKRLLLFVFQPFFIAYLATAIFSREFRRQFVFPRRPFHLVILPTMVFSLLLSSAVNFGGNTVFFFWYPRIAALLYAVDLMRFLLAKRPRLFIIPAVIILLVGVAPCISFIFTRIDLTSRAAQDRERDSRDSIDHDEWDAMRWIRQNTRPDAIFITDRRHLRIYRWRYETSRFFYYSALSGRQFWAEGEDFMYGQNRRVAEERWRLIGCFLHAADSTRQPQALPPIPADYFIHSRRFNRTDYATHPFLNQVFANVSVIVYRIITPPV